MATCNLETLLSDSCTNDFDHLSFGDKLAILLQLLCNISETGASGGALYGVVDPEGAVTAAPGRTYWNTANQTFWVKNAGSGNTGWIQLI